MQSESTQTYLNPSCRATRMQSRKVTGRDEKGIPFSNSEKLLVVSLIIWESPHRWLMLA